MVNKLNLDMSMRMYVIVVSRRTSTKPKCCILLFKLLLFCYLNLFSHGGLSVAYFSKDRSYKKTHRKRMHNNYLKRNLGCSLQNLYRV